MHTNAAYEKPENKLRVKLYHVARNYGLTVPEFFALYEANGRKCLVCSEDIALLEIQIDHDHKTKQVRGILCKACNLGLGHFKDNPALLRAAASYLERFSCEEIPPG